MECDDRVYKYVKAHLQGSAHARGRREQVGRCH